MPINIEMKARARDWESQIRTARRMFSRSEVLRQEDIFFNCPNGRLKLRRLGPERAELIFYRRDDQAGPKRSLFLISPSPDPDSMRELLSEAYGESRTVEKRRLALLGPQTRVHFDEVEGLGRFLEVEYTLRPGQAHAEGRAAVDDLMGRLGIREEDLLETAYADMLGDGAARPHA
ncbi:class IV adenylate cyclase [Elusimicrobiota bacterium]